MTLFDGRECPKKLSFFLIQGKDICTGARVQVDALHLYSDPY